MKPLQLVALNLAARNITGKLEQFGDEFQIRVTTIDDVFKAEAVAKKLQERFGLTLYVAF
jgi:hypothetical protein